MPDKRVREEGFSKDADKLIRRLSLVSLLLSRRGRPVGVDQVRTQVEGYSGMTDEAFKRRFYEDRSELEALGIAIVAEPGGDGATDLYSLPGDAYYLSPVAFEPDELTALGACLAVLEDRFAYSQPLRLALLSLSQGRPELLADAETPPLTVVPDAGAPPAALPKLQDAAADRKTVTFDYYAIARDETATRTVDPYGLQLVAGEWYLIGRCHTREAVRTFRLSRIRSRVTHATRAPHDFQLPATFDIARYRDRPAWQLAEVREEATIRVSPAMAWWVAAHWSHCGRLEEQDDGAVVYTTGYAAARPLLSWVLGLGDAAEVVAPAELRDQTRERLAHLRDLLGSPAPAGALEDAGPAGGGRRRTADDWHVEVDRFTRLTALSAYLLGKCGGDEAALDAREVRAALGVTAKELRDDVRLLNLVNFGGDGLLLYAEFDGRDTLNVTCELAGDTLARPSRLSPLQADTLLLAIELVGGQLPTASGRALESAAAKLREARGVETGLAGGDLLVPAGDVLTAVNDAIVARHPLIIEYWTEGTDKVATRTVEPYLLVRSRGEWYYVCWCRTAGGTRVFRVATTKSVETLPETFSPRPEVELDVYRREGIPTSGSYAPKTATVWYSPVVARWIAERMPVRRFDDGACLASQPYVDERWLAGYVLRFAGEARPLDPPEAVAGVRAVVDRLLERYA